LAKSLTRISTNTSSIFTFVCIVGPSFSGIHYGPYHGPTRGVNLWRFLGLLEARYELLRAKEQHQGRGREVEDEVEPHVVEEEEPEDHVEALARVDNLNFVRNSSK